MGHLLQRAAVPLSCLAAVLSTGCYEYVPASLDAVPVGARVRAQLSSEAEFALHDSLGVNLRVLSGTLVDREERRLLVQVRTAAGARAFGTLSLYQRIAVTPRDVLRLEVRRMNAVKTGGLAAALVAAATVAAVRIFGHRRPGTPEPPPGPPPEQIWGVP